MTAPAYTPPPSPASPTQDPYALVAGKECSLCSAPWYAAHPGDCQAKVFTPESLERALTERLEPYLAQAYARGASDALHRLRSSLSSEHQALVDGLLADYDG